MGVASMCAFMFSCIEYDDNCTLPMVVVAGRGGFATPPEELVAGMPCGLHEGVVEGGPPSALQQQQQRKSQGLPRQRVDHKHCTACGNGAYRTAAKGQFGSW
jgi:hypothetical protein